ncbi:DUF4105 domain-containing protein [Thiospirochaeta perfilievii]|nr:DUF4105 domain-containing protein [Thiospirochaeta perfilievii]
MKSKILILLLLFSTFTQLYSSETKIYLATIGPGDDIFLRWGHFAIVVDYPEKKDLLFDYGNFSFSQDEFVPNFIKGIMTYLKLRKSADYELRAYTLENRDIILQELNLTPKQVDIYIEKLLNEVKPENRYYQYDHYYNNCVSQMSDFLDNLTDGEFYKGTSKLTGRSFRDLSRDYVSSNYLYNTLIMFVLGSKVDYNITQKESMFLPDYTAKRADEVYISNGNGGKKPLVRDKIILNRSKGRDPVIVNAKPKVVLNLIIGSILALISLGLSRFRKVSNIMQVLVGLIFGLAGSLLFFMSFFTEHYYIHNNWNLIMINPLTISLFISGVLKLTKRFKNLGYRISSLYIDSTLLLIAFMLVLKATGLIVQGNGEIIALIAPLYLVNSSFKLLR